MGKRWEDMEQVFVQVAADDLETCGEVTPALAAFTGERLRFCAWLRPFAKGAYRDPLIELLALAVPLHADRLVFSIAGRVWSLDDPVPPVSADGDLRQRVLTLHVVDGAGDAVTSSSVLYPFDLAGRRVRWQEPRRLGAGEGWIPGALAAVVRERHRLRPGAADIGEQARRVVDLGHQLFLAEDILERLLSGGVPGGSATGRRPPR